MVGDDVPLRNIIVNHLPTGMTEDEMKQMFERCGPVESAKLIMNKSTNTSMKYGFVLFEQKESAYKAIKELNGKRANTGTSLRVAYAAAPGQSKGMEGKCENIYVAGFRDIFTKEKIRELFNLYGEVVDVKLLDTQEKKYSKGVSFVKYTSAAEAESAIVNMNTRDMSEWGGEGTLTVKYAEKANKPTTKLPSANPVLGKVTPWVCYL